MEQLTFQNTDTLLLWPIFRSRRKSSVCFVFLFPFFANGLHYGKIEMFKRFGRKYEMAYTLRYEAKLGRLRRAKWILKAAFH